MKINIKKRGAALGLGLLMAFQTPVAAFLPSLNPVATVYAYPERSATIKATSLNIRSDAGTNASVVARLTYGTAVTVIGEKKASDGVCGIRCVFPEAAERPRPDMRPASILSSQCPILRTLTLRPT